MIAFKRVKTLPEGHSCHQSMHPDFIYESIRVDTQPEDLSYEVLSEEEYKLDFVLNEQRVDEWKALKDQTGAVIVND